MFNEVTQKDIDAMLAEIEHRKCVVRKELLEDVKTAIIIEDQSSDDEVGINKIVELYFEDDDEVEEFKIVTTVRGNSLKNLVSTESPIGKAILGHKVGDRCYVAINEKAGYYVEIKSITPADSNVEEDLRKF